LNPRNVPTAPGLGSSPLHRRERLQFKSTMSRLFESMYLADASNQRLTKCCENARAGDTSRRMTSTTTTGNQSKTRSGSSASVTTLVGLSASSTSRNGTTDFVRLGLVFAHERFAGRRVLLDVAEFDVRARKVYQRAGFRVTGSHPRRFESDDLMFVDVEER
jgi:hypothetical protein